MAISRFDSDVQKAVTVSEVPKVSVLLSVWNGLPYLPATLQSILEQSLQDFEFVIVDNASTDGTVTVLEDFASRFDKIVLIKNSENLGHSGGLNRGLEVCRAPWIARMDADDIALPTRLERQLDFVTRHPDVRLTSSLVYYIDTSGRRIGKTQHDLLTPQDYERYMLHNEMIGLWHPAVLMSREVCLRAGGYREQFGGANDIDLWNRMAEGGNLVLVQPEYLVEYRMHPGAISAKGYMRSRLQHEYARTCTIRRRAGGVEPTWDDFIKEWTAAPLWARANRWRKHNAKRLYRQAGLHLVSRNRLKAFGSLAISLLLQPAYGLPRLINQRLASERNQAVQRKPLEEKLESSHPVLSAEHLTEGITCVIACYNGEDFIAEAVDSCLNQSLLPEEIIVINDGSTDGTKQALENFRNNSRVRIIDREKNVGKAKSLNDVFGLVRTEFIALMDADDVSLPNRFEEQIRFMKQHPSVGCSSAFVNYMNTEGKRIAKGGLDLTSTAVLKRYLAGNEPFGLFCPAVILRTQVFEDPSLRFRSQFWPADDIDLWNRIAEAGWEVLAQPEYLVNYRVHGTSIITSKFDTARDQYDHVRACLRARRAGRREPSRAEFQNELMALSWLQKLNRWRRNAAKKFYRNAGFRVGEGRIAVALLGIFIALILQPSYVFPRLRLQMRS